MPCGSAVFARSRSTEFAKVRLTVTSRRASSSSTAGRFADRLEHAREHVGRRSEGRGVTLEAAVHVADYQGRYRDWSEPVKEAIEEDDEQHPRAAAATGCPTRTGEDGRPYSSSSRLVHSDRSDHAVSALRPALGPGALRVVESQVSRSAARIALSANVPS